MIKIDRPAIAPSILSNQGRRRKATHCRKYGANEASYQNGTATFPFDSSIYADQSVKDALVAMQHSKCCYCEKRIGTEGDVEHFRPKGSVCQDLNSTTLTPGYYWLAYEWSNLLFSCKECNQLHKRTQFPLADSNNRIRFHNDGRNLSDEGALLINPVEVNPNSYIGFREEFAYAINGDAFAEAAIRVCGLNRPELRDARRRRLKDLRLLRAILLLASRGKLEPEDQELIQRTTTELEDATKKSAEFSAMVASATP